MIFWDAVLFWTAKAAAEMAMLVLLLALFFILLAICQALFYTCSIVNKWKKRHEAKHPRRSPLDNTPD